MAFGSPESAGIPRLAYIVFTVKGNPQQSSYKKSEFHPSSRWRSTAAFVLHRLHSPCILYGDSTNPDPSCITLSYHASRPFLRVVMVAGYSCVLDATLKKQEILSLGRWLPCGMIVSRWTNVSIIIIMFHARYCSHDKKHTLSLLPAIVSSSLYLDSSN